MLLATTTVRLDPDRRAEALDLITDLAEQSREEPGTIAYHVTTDLLDPNVVRFVERYADEAALESHTALAAYRRFNERLPDLMVGGLDT
jgi:quinol monooxygenase YgiN